MLNTILSEMKQLKNNQGKLNVIRELNEYNVILDLFK